MPAGLDAESAGWVRALAGAGPRREAALARLHEMLVRIAHGEAARRGPRLRIAGPELDDLAYQAAADALVAITGKIGQFRGESRFTTWACKDSELTPRQRDVFVAIVLNDVPLDTLVIHLGSSRNAIYQAMFEARRKLRAALAADGYLGHDTAGRS